MEIFAVCCDCNSREHNDAPFLATLATLGAQHSLQTLWLFKSPLSAREVTDKLLALLGEGDRLLVIEIGPRTRWAATHLDDAAGPWLLSRRP